MGLETALVVASVGSTVMQAQQQSAAGKYNQAIQNRNAQIGSLTDILPNFGEYELHRIPKNYML